MAKNFKITVNSKKLKRFLKKAPDIVKPAIAQALYEEAQSVMKDSQDNYVPVKLGNLMASGQVLLPDTSGGQISVTMRYGGPEAPYAAYVHEIDKNYNNGKTWKYLEKPAKAAAKDVRKAVAEAAQRAFKKNAIR